MENPQAQMPQGQQGPAPEQMQQGAPQGPPQQGGQDAQMQQIMQMVQQMMQQGAQPIDAAAELLNQQVPPEIIMQIFVQMGMPEQDAQAAIEQAMQGGQQPQNPGEEQMEGPASNPQEEMVEQGAPAPEQGGQPSPAEEIQMKYGGRMPRRLRSYAEGGDNQEMQAVMQQVQDMMAKGADAKQVMEQIQAAVQQGQISPEVGASVMEQLGGMQQATDPQGDDAAMTAQSQDPQMVDPNMAAPEAQMMKFGGNLKKLMSRAYGGPAVAPGTDSKTYAKDRTSMFVGAVKNNAYKSTLDDEFPSLVGSQMAYGGDLPKAGNGIIMKDGKLALDPAQFKSEAEYKAAALDWNMDPANKDNQVTGDLLKTNTWKAPEPTYEAGKNYNYDPATKQWTAAAGNQFQFAEGDVMGRDAQGSYVTRKDGTMQRVPGTENDGLVRDANGNVTGMQFAPNGGYNQGYGAVNPVGYGNPMGNSFWDNVNASASPFGRMVAGIGRNNMYDPRITGANLPGGMSGAQFLGAVGQNGLVPGMAGNVAGQNWRVGEAERFKEGSIFKGNRRKGVRYQIDWGNAAPANPAAPDDPKNNTLAENSTPTGQLGEIKDPAFFGNQGTPVLDAQGKQITSDGSNMSWNSGNMPTIGNQGTTVKAYGGNVDPAALENAVALINRAFGGMMPKAINGLDLGSEDTNGDKIPDYLQKGSFEQSDGKKLDINWNQVGSAAGDMYMNAAGKVTNFANKINAMDPERDMAKESALNRPSDTYDTMNQGIYDQAGNFIPNDIGNQVLNPTDVNFNNQRQIFAYGGRVYEIGGQVDLDDNEMEELAAAGFKLSRV